MQIMQNNLYRGFEKYQQELEQAALRVLRSGWYVLGKEVLAFEEEFASYVGSRYCVGLASGLDALWLAFRALKITQGDEVIVQANTYIASVMGITMNGATPIFVEPDEYYNIDAAKIEERITSKTKAILVVHLYGQASNMGPVMELCERYGLYLVEDCAQSHGACFQNTMTGNFGHIGCFSFYPSKNLGAFGDAGAITTNDSQLAEDMRVLRNYGSEKRYHNKVVGANSRLDELQAALLRVRLAHLEELTEERQRMAHYYEEGIHNELLHKPQLRAGATSVWHQYVLRTAYRDELEQYLKEKGITTIVHYPIPPHLSEAYGYLGHKKGAFPITETYADSVLSLPMYYGMTREEQDYVIEALNQFQK